MLVDFRIEGVEYFVCENRQEILIVQEICYWPDERETKMTGWFLSRWSGGNVKFIDFFFLELILDVFNVRFLLLSLSNQDLLLVLQMAYFEVCFIFSLFSRSLQFFLFFLFILQFILEIIYLRFSNNNGFCSFKIALLALLSNSILD